MATAELDAPAIGRRSPPAFYTWGAITAVAVVLAGFSRTFYLNPYLAKFPLTGLLVLHGAIMTTWFATFLVQTRLVATGRTRIHRRVGVFGAFVALAVLIVATTTAIVGAKAGHAPPGAPPPLVFLVVPLGDMVVFAGLVGTGLLLRRKPETHKRLMLLATLGILTAAIARIPIDALQSAGLPAFFLVTDVIVLVFGAWDTIRNRRLHPAFGWGFAYIVLSQVVRFAIAGTPQWMAFARWLTG